MMLLACSSCYFSLAKFSLFSLSLCVFVFNSYDWSYGWKLCVCESKERFFVGGGRGEQEAGEVSFFFY